MTSETAGCRRENLSKRDVLALFERYRIGGDDRAHEALIKQFLPLALALSRRYAAGSEHEDVEQVAAIGLLKAIERFDPGRGLAFTSFAMPTILGEIKRYFRDYGWMVRVPRSLQELRARVDRVSEELVRELGRAPTAEELARQCEVSVEAVLEALAAGSAHYADSLDRPSSDDEDTSRGELIGTEDDGYERAEYAADMERLMRRLTERDRQIVRLRFGHDLTQREIAARVGLSQMHVSRLLKDAITTLREDCRRQPAPR